MTSPETRTVCGNFPAYAYEVQPGDEVNGREASTVEDPDRPDTPFHPVGPGTVTISYADGEPTTHDRMDEVEIRRCWEAAPAPQPVEY